MALPVIAAFLGYFALFLFLLLSLITAAHPLTPIKYLMAASKDQAWYFGTDPQAFLNWHDILSQLTRTFLLYAYGITALLVATILILRKLNSISNKHLLVAIFMLTYGIIAFIVPALGGYFSPAQAIPLVRAVALILTLFALTAPFNKWFSRKRKTKINNKIIVSRATLIAGFIIYAAFATFNGGAYLYHARHLRPIQLLKMARVDVHSDDYQIASPGWKAAIDSFSFAFKDKRVQVWSTYESLYESQAGRLQPSSQGHDYIIHALGPERRNNYESQFINSKPGFAITLKQSYFPFEEWLWSRHWTMYRDILLNYSLVKSNSSHYLWEYNSGTSKPPESPWKKLKVVGSGPTTLPPPADVDTAIFEIKIDYKASAVLPLTNNLPRYLVKLENSGTTYDISLPPYETSWQFPVSYFKEKGVIGLRPTVDGIFPGKLTITSIQYRRMDISNANAKIFTEDYCYHYLPNGGGEWRKTPVCTKFTTAEGL